MGKVFKKILERRVRGTDRPVSHATFLLALGSYLCELHKAVVTNPSLTSEQQVALQPLCEEYADFEVVFTAFTKYTNGNPR